MRVCVCVCVHVCVHMCDPAFYVRVPTYVALVNVPVDGSMLIKVTPE